MAGGVTFLEHITLLRKMQGQPLVSYPYGDAAFPVVERVIDDFRVRQTKTFGDAEFDPERFPNMKLVEFRETGGDMLRAEFYFRFELLPGKEIQESAFDENGDTIYTWRQRVVKATGEALATLGATKETATVVDCDYQPDNDFCGTLITTGIILPGKDNRTEGIDEETGVTTFEWRQKIKKSLVLPNTVPWETIKDTLIVYFSEYQPINDVYGTLITKAIDMPGSRTEKKSIGFQFPGEVEFLSSWNDPPLISGQPRGPYLGSTHEVLLPRSASKPATVTYSYSIGPSGTVPNTFTVYAPGAGSRYFPITANTLHDAYTLIYTLGALVIEDVDASDPTRGSYTPGDTLIIQASEEPWKGPFFRQAVVTIEE